MLDSVLALLQPRGRGLEVAPYFDPLLPKGGDYDVLYTDYIATCEIRAKAVTNPGYGGAEVPAVDFVWPPGERLRACVPHGMEFDYAVASHVMEHVPDPVGWLCELLSVLRTGGRIAVFLPDRRRNFDFFRRPTSFAELVSLWILQPSVPTPQQVADFMGQGFSHQYGAMLTWENDHPGETTRPYTDAEAVDAATFVAANNNYMDVHTSVWEPNQFIEVFQRLIDVGMLNVSMSDPIAVPVEFAVVLTKLGEPKRTPPGRPAAQPSDSLTPALESVIHQLGVLRNDMTFSIARNQEIALDLSRQSAELAALRRDFVRHSERRWGLARPLIVSWQQRARLWSSLVRRHGV